MTAIDPLLRLMQGPPPRRYNRTKHSMAGCTMALQMCHFVLWAETKRAFPSIEAIQDRFGVCRATAYRWSRAYAEAKGAEEPEARHGGRWPQERAA